MRETLPRIPLLPSTFFCTVQVRPHPPLRLEDTNLDPLQRFSRGITLDGHDSQKTIFDRSFRRHGRISEIVTHNFRLLALLAPDENLPGSVRHDGKLAAARYAFAPLRSDHDRGVRANH